MERYKEHINGKKHKAYVAQIETARAIKARANAKDPTLSSRDRSMAKINAAQQMSLTSFFLPHNTSGKAPCEGLAKFQVRDDSPKNREMTELIITDDGKRKKSCMGVFRQFKKKQEILDCHNQYFVLPPTSKYKFGFFNATLLNIYAKSCNGSDGIHRGKGFYACELCESMRKKEGFRIFQTISARALKANDAMQHLKLDELVPSNIESLRKFVNGATDENVTEAGRHLFKKIKDTLRFYKEIEDNKEIKKKSVSNVGFVSQDKFIKAFLEMYNDEKGPLQNSLLLSIMKCFIAKANGHKNARYGIKVQSFMLAIDSISGPAYEFVSGNLGLMSERHVRRLCSVKRQEPYISLSKDAIKACIINQINMIRSMTQDTDCLNRIAFSLGIDGTAVVPSFDYIPSAKAIVGGAAPTHFMDVGELNLEEIRSRLKQCIDPKNEIGGEKAKEIKLSIGSFQQTPQGISPYLVLNGLPQSINENNDFPSVCIQACIEAAKAMKNVAFLNSSTDGVSCEVQNNLQLTLKYLHGKADQVSLPDPNHNNKNQCYQYIGGSGAAGASIGYYVVDPYFVARAGGVSPELVRVNDYASDMVVLRLFSAAVVKGVLELKTNDVGNQCVTALSLVFSRMRSFAVNSRSTDWKTRAIFTYASLLWTTSFHTSGSTMMPNKRNCVLETVGLLFLLPRDDFPEPRRATSEANEHMYGQMRQYKREFTVADSIYIVDKLRLRTDSLYQGDLVSDRSNAARGYGGTFPDFLASTKRGSIKPMKAGPVHVDLDDPAVHQVWPEVLKIITIVNMSMKPFLEFFGVVEGNGISPFLRAYETPEDLAHAIEQFFRPPRRDPRDYPHAQGNTNDNPNYDVSQDDDDYEVEVIGNETRTSSHNNSCTDNVSVSYVKKLVSEIVALPDKDDDEEEMPEEIDVMPAAREVNEPSSDEVLTVFRTLLKCTSIQEINEHVLSLIQLLQMGKIEQGSLSSAAKYKSLQARWFSAKNDITKMDKSEVDEKGMNGMFIERDRLVTINVKRGKQQHAALYRVLSIFSKHYNKWFFHLDDEQISKNEETGKKYKILVRMVKRTMNEYEDVELKKDGIWSPKAVFHIANVSDVIDIGPKLQSMDDMWE